MTAPTPSPVTDEMVERAADAMERADVGYHLQLVKLIDGVHTYTLSYDDEAKPIEFNCTEDAYAHIAARKRDAQARAALTAALDGMVVVPREPTEEMLRASKHVTKGCKTIAECDAAVYRAMIAASAPKAQGG